MTHRPDLSGRTAIITGGTDGIGKEIARKLGMAGAELIVVGRDASKGRAVEIELRAICGHSQAHFLQADLSLLGEAERLANEIRRRWPQIHYLVHSAGVLIGSRKLTAEGIETNFAINYLSRFALTRHLLSLLAATGQPGHPARMLLVSGEARGRVYFDDVSLASSFTTIKAIRQFCRANDLLTLELANLIEDERRHIVVECLKLGPVKTAIRRNFPLWMKVLVPLLDPFLTQTPEEAARSAVAILLDPQLEAANGAIFSKMRALKRLPPLDGEDVREERNRLWALSDRLVDLGGASLSGVRPSTARFASQAEAVG